MVKSLEFTNVFDGLEGRYANGKGIKETSNIRPKSITKAKKHRCNFHARKKKTKNMNNHPTSDQKRE